MGERKMKLAMKVVDDPDRLQSSVGNLWSACIAVLATLRLQFARLIALALGVADMIAFPIARCIAPALIHVLGPNLNHWTNTIIDSTVKIICILLAWYAQAFISAFYAGLRGGKMFAQGSFNIL